ncbi:hypothetical protein L9F63_015005 [Diploptera punctata]|uniref:Ras-related protein Rab-24 n=1 Tax=Diploptera punctata TaxID=6984 RepID=A0AAD7Z9Y8_DIPPU|nr:hypothetical protein L9F63_025469 [Diploptera punctata]KAJ9593438.1 hypothetical protein L9F63_015005 [Diploptera punctata]
MSKVDLKVVLLGSEYVGKTSLLERYVYDRFRGSIPYQNTIGAAFAAKEVELNGCRFMMGIWDTAGSERYEAMSRIYYRGAKAAIVCYDITNKTSWDRAKFWINELRRFEENCKIYVVGTKVDVFLDKTIQRSVELDVVTRYTNGIQAQYMETSSKTGENVQELFHLISTDYLANPENAQQLEETIVLNERDKRGSCCLIGS